MLREKWDLCELAMTLNGPIQPTGNHELDRIRLSNLRVLTDLIDDLVAEVKEVLPAAERSESSMQKIGITAKNYLEDLQESLL